MKCYIYCTKSKPTIEMFDNKCHYLVYGKRNELYCLNGKIVASFDLNKVEKMGLDTGNGLEFVNNFNKESQLTLEEIANYVGDNYYYAWHIDNLEILNVPMQLSYFRSYELEGIKKAPQSWCYACLLNCTPVYVECNYIGDDIDFEDCIIISIKPEWVCKILNGEKTIEIRKNAPKELIKNE